MAPPLSAGSVVLTWNSIYLDSVRQVGGAPGPLACVGGLMHLAMYEAVNQLGGNPYFNVLDPVALPPSGSMPSPKASAAYAACYTLVDAMTMLIGKSFVLDQNHPNPCDSMHVMAGAKAHVASIADGLLPGTGDDPATDDDSKAYGRSVATALLAKFPLTDELDPTMHPGPLHVPGEWRETTPGTGALTPNWGKLPLFLLSQPETPANDQYRPKAIPAVLLNYDKLLMSELYTTNLAEVRSKGGADQATTTRMEEETEIAFFWANDMNCTYKPPGQLYNITQIVAQQQGTPDDDTTGLLETARLFAMVGTAMINASIVAWQAKYFNPNMVHPMRLWRPETAIQLDADNPAVAWQPLSMMTNGMHFSPNFPAYVSGHSTFAAAWAAAIGDFYETDNISFTATTEDPHAIRDADGHPLSRSFTSFMDAAKEDGRSRVYLGVHYQFDADGGYEIGTAVGRDTAALFRKQLVAAAH